MYVCRRRFLGFSLGCYIRQLAARVKPKRLGTPNLLTPGALRPIGQRREGTGATSSNYHTPRTNGSWALSVYGLASLTAPILVVACLQVHVAIAGGLQMLVSLSRQRRHCLLGLAILIGFTSRSWVAPGNLSRDRPRC